MPDTPPPEPVPTAPPLTAAVLAGLLSDARRLRVLAAVALDADADDVAATAGVSAKDAAAALHRLRAAGLVEERAERPVVAYDALRALAASRDEPDDDTPAELRPFVSGGRLRSMPSAPSRRRSVLEHVAALAFEVGVDYDERAVNALLDPWCEGGDVDRAALRRYLVEGGHVTRGGGVYRRGGEPVPPSLAEERVVALGLS